MASYHLQAGCPIRNHYHGRLDFDIGGLRSKIIVRVRSPERVVLVRVLEKVQHVRP